MKVQQIETSKGRTWEVDGYLINGGQKVRVKKRGFDSKRSAQQWFNNESVLFDNGESRYNKKTTPDIMTVKELYDMWLETYQHTVEESTLNKTMNVFDVHVIPKWGEYIGIRY